MLPMRRPSGQARRSRVPSSTLAVVAFAGLMILGALIGFVVPRLWHGLGSVGTAAWLALTAGALTALLVLAALLTWARRMRWPARLALLVAVAVTLYGLGLPTGLATAAVFPPRADLGNRTPADLGLAGAEVQFTTADGVRLAGWYVPSSTGAAVAVVPGATSSRTGVLGQAAVLARRGYGVLLVDPRGMGHSDGHGMNLGWTGDLDLVAAVDFLAARPDVRPTRIGLLGESLGGEMAIGSAGTDPRVGAVVAEGATNRVAADKAWLTSVYGVRGTAQRAVDHVTQTLTSLASGTAPPASLASSARATAPRPILLVAAGEVPDEQHAATWIAASRSHVSIWVVPGAQHTGGLTAQPREWEKRVIDFFDHALR